MEKTYSLVERTKAWSVHVFTASGLIPAFLAILCIADHDFRSAMLWLMLALFIDGVDGTFARIWKVKEVLPNMDGKTIDYVIDFATYAIIPAYFIYEANILPTQLNMLSAFLILIVSAVYYGMEGMVSEDLYFIGFPVMWNMVAFYLFFVLGLPPIINFGLIVFFATIHFVPIKFAYPSRKSKYQFINIGASLLFLVSNCLVIWFYPTVPIYWIIASLVALGYFAVMAVYNTWIEK